MGNVKIITCCFIWLLTRLQKQEKLKITIQSANTLYHTTIQCHLNFTRRAFQIWDQICSCSKQQHPAWHWACCRVGMRGDRFWGNNEASLDKRCYQRGTPAMCFHTIGRCDTLRHVVTLSAVVSQDQEWPCIVSPELLPLLLVLNPPTRLPL